MIPLKNCYRANYQLGFELDFGLGWDGKDWARAEEILQEVAKASQWESYYEAGPQASQQLMIGFSTGRFRPGIVFSIIVSLLSLSWGASRTYFMERSKDKADPDPDVFMVGLRVFPWMVLMVLNSLVQWVLLGGLLGPWVFLVIAINFLCNYTTVQCLYKKKNCETIVKQQCIKVKDIDEESGQQMAPLVKPGKPKSGNVGSKNKGFFLLKASLTAMWLPAVVGDQDGLFLATVVSTLVTKIFALIIAVVLAFLGHQEAVFPHPIFLWCEKEWEKESLNDNIDLCSFDNYSNTTLVSCFEFAFFKSTSALKQKLRVCGSEEDELILNISILAVVIVTNCLALGAALWLKKITDFVELYEATKHLLWFIPTNPIIHRSALLSVVSSEEEADFKILEEMMGVENIETVINRPNAEGDTALHQACRMNMPKKAALLIKHGANYAANNKDETPYFSLVKSNYESDINSFQEELQTEIEDFVKKLQEKWQTKMEDFTSKSSGYKKSAFEHACITSNWRTALVLKGSHTEESSKDIKEILTEGRGIQHIVECPTIISLLGTWGAAEDGEEKEKVEQKIGAFFTEEVTMIFLPVHKMEEEEKQELGRNMIKWNRGHSMKGGKLFGSHSGVMC